ncbi:hypothetical protein BCR33DRAFT_97857 [Rhizoclosmatium globosum]|uniref:Uncharacterized protein n=1 Tax=Rhizoclosmatium globosum TaxID=329046 RepID=A0A1Y2CKC5_9FUNG|nr:hypothetical protein BCR33DRAFT_97857 [Rhizoclosmatium globosum]|eukprot:ORY47473.1 hypothetical protein BCR33DRAFT_97857 [Rhizoclosmatium globosum]
MVIRRIIVLALFSSTIGISIYCVGTVLKSNLDYPEKKLSLAKWLSLTTAIVFFVHATSGIYVTLDINNEIFSLSTLLILVVSCASTLVYQMLMMVCVYWENCHIAHRRHYSS